MPLFSYDKLFGGKPGAAAKARASMHKSYGKQKGETVFQATIAKRELKAKRAKQNRRKR